MNIACVLAAALLTSATTAAPKDVLPIPHFHRAPDDPVWLVRAAYFHGHLGPWAISGIRLGSAARKAAEADGYMDVEVVCHGPFEKTPRSCFIDGLQLGTGATLGKRNLTWKDGDEIRVTLTNTRTGKVVEVRPTKELRAKLEALAAKVEEATKDLPEAQKHDAETGVVEGSAREIALLPDAEILTVSKPSE